MSPMSSAMVTFLIVDDTEENLNRARRRWKLFSPVAWRR